MRYTKLQVLDTLLSTKLAPIFYHPDAGVAGQALAAAAAGGARLFEFTNRGDFALDVFSKLSADVASVGGADVILGVGSVVDAPTAAMYIQAGANFIVAPGFNAEVARLCNRRQVPYIPGCGTATEIGVAQEAGCEVCKVFPGGSVGGPDFIRSVLGPMPWSLLMVTGGVQPTRESIRSWIDAGAACVGLGSQLFSSSAVAAGDWQSISARVAEALSFLKG